MDIQSANLNITVNSTGTKALDLSTPNDQFPATAFTGFQFTDGTGALKAEQHYHDTITLADGASTELDLAGGLTDAFGDTITLTKLKGIYLKNKSADATLIYGHSAANGIPIVNAAALANAGGILIPPGGADIKIAADADGWLITAGTGDKLKLEHDGTGSSTMDVDIYLLGEVT